MKTLLLANFGGPRSLEEVRPFLEALLTDDDVLQTPLPFKKHLFTWIAKRRSEKVKHDYMHIGGRSPIYSDTERLAQELRSQLSVITFHRYLTSTHAKTLSELRQASNVTLFPLFPQFTYATTGSVARYFKDYPLQCIPSFATHPAFINHFIDALKAYPEAFFLFSAHGLPKAYVLRGDPYEAQCEASVRAVMQHFPNDYILAYQSKFGMGRWLEPSTHHVALNIKDYAKRYREVVIIPISFTSDHIETLYEIEQLYLPLLKRSHSAFRLPTPQLTAPDILHILRDTPTLPIHSLIRPR